MGYFWRQTADANQDVLLLCGIHLSTQMCRILRNSFKFLRESRPGREGKHARWSGTKLRDFHALPDSEIYTSERADTVSFLLWIDSSLHSALMSKVRSHV